MGRCRALAPLLLAEETETLVVEAEAEAEAGLARSLATRRGQALLAEEEALIRAYRDGLDATTRGLRLPSPPFAY